MTVKWIFESQQDLIGPRGKCCLSVLFFPAFILRYVSPTVAVLIGLSLPSSFSFHSHCWYYTIIFSPLSRPRSLPHSPFSQHVAGSLPLNTCESALRWVTFIGALNKTALEQVCVVFILYMCLSMHVPVNVLFLITVHSVTQLYTIDRVCCCAARQRGKIVFSKQ